MTEPDQYLSECEPNTAQNCLPCAPAESVPPDSPFLPQAAAIERQLIDAGITPERLLAQWGIILWSIRPKEGYVRLKVDARTALHITQLEHWFEAILGQPVSVAQCDLSECCQKPCKGCLWGNPSKRAFWDPQVTSPRI